MPHKECQIFLGYFVWMPPILEYMVREYQKKGEEKYPLTQENVEPCKLSVANSVRSNTQEQHATCVQ